MTTAVNEQPAAQRTRQAHPAAGLPRLLPAARTPEPLRAHLARLGPVPYRDRGNRTDRTDNRTDRTDRADNRTDRTDRTDRTGRTGRTGRNTRPGSLIADVEAAGLTGRGGAAFPVHRKLAIVANARGRKVIVANGAESEPASHKDAMLLRLAPNLVLDGLQLAAEAIGAREAHLYLHQGASPEILRALAERSAANLDRIEVTVTQAPPRFLAGQEAALVNRLGGGPALPTQQPPRVSERGLGGAPTLVQNVETLAHLALIARHGPQWFRALGTDSEPGSMLATIYHATTRPEVVEAEIGTPLRTLMKNDGEAQALLIGGFHGTWLPMPQAAELTMDNKALSRHGAALGAGLLAALPNDRCGLAEAARITRYLAAESAGQCGPCLNGLPRIAAALTELAGPRPRRKTREDAERWAGLVTGRGACGHPDGTARFVRSALTVFAPELARHERGRCSATDQNPFLPLPPGMPMTEEDWT
jgi:NADH:ubiquinone oxidoreductase subunit F (NADH-binding)